MSVLIREMNIGDYEETIKLWMSVEGVVLSDADGKEQMAKYLNRNREMSFVAEVDKRIIGAVLGGHDGRRGYLHHLTVSALYRGEKIATRLVEHCLDKLRKEEIKRCHLFVLSNNQQGADFWKNIGFDKQGHLDVFSKNV